MIWLVAQMWAWLALAGVSGGLIGWALSRRRRQSFDASDRIEVEALEDGDGATVTALKTQLAELQSELAAEREEIVGLKAKLSSVSSKIPSETTLAPTLEASEFGTSREVSGVSATEGATTVSQGEEEFAWKNRYLESRVRFLEGRVEELEGGALNLDFGSEDRQKHVEEPPLTEDLLETSVSDLDLERLQWRVRYLTGRVRYLEEERVKSGFINGLRPLEAASLLSGALRESASDTGLESAVAQPSKAASSKSAKQSVSGEAQREIASHGPTPSENAQPSAESKALWYSGGAMPEWGDPDLADSGRPSSAGTISKDEKDDLKAIAGIGPKIEGILNDLGVFRFSQIADWTPEQIEWIDARLSFKGRILREQWVSQAKRLASEGSS